MKRRIIRGMSRQKLMEQVRNLGHGETYIAQQAELLTLEDLEK